MLAQLERLVRQDSPSTNKSLVDKCGETLSNLIQTTLDVRPEVVVQKEAGNHLVFTVGSGRTKVLILGHFDTVWDPGVLSMRIEGNRAYGPGIFDMKAGIIQGIWALKAICSCQLSMDAEVTFLLTTDEEIGSGTSQAYIEDYARKVDVVYVLEPSVGKTGAIKTARKGAFIYPVHRGS